MPRLCGSGSCPILTRVKSETSERTRMSGEIVEGASPPSVFVGEAGYPNVYAGPLVPHSVQGDTSTYDNPAAWLDKTVEQILEYRMALVQSIVRIDALERCSKSLLTPIGEWTGRSKIAAYHRSQNTLLDSASTA